MKLIWMILLAGGLAEGAWVIFLNYSENLTRPMFVGLAVLFMVLSTVCLIISTRAIPSVIAYAVWTGIGAVSAVLATSILFPKVLDWVHLLFIVLIIVGVIGLRLTTQVSAGN